MEKTKQFYGKNVDLERLSIRIGCYLEENKFQQKYSKNIHNDSQMYLIQARKRNALNRIFGSSCTEIVIQGDPYNFVVSIGTGVWGKISNLRSPLSMVAAVGTPARVGKLYNSRNFEENLWSFIKDQGKDLENSYSGQTLREEEFSCDYIEGFPGWKKPILRGKLILDHQQGHRCLLFNMGEDKGMMIPPLKLIKAEIISKNTKISNPDRTVRIIFRDEKGKKHKPLFNFKDLEIKSVLSGINELIVHAKKDKVMVKPIH